MRTKTSVATILSDLCLDIRNLEPLCLVIIESELVGSGLYRVARILPGPLIFLDYWQYGDFNFIGTFTEKNLAGQKEIVKKVDC